MKNETHDSEKCGVCIIARTAREALLNIREQNIAVDDEVLYEVVYGK